jgi:hypothetical protein
MLRKPKYAWCNDRTRLAEENPTAGNPHDWLTRRSLEGTGLQSISFDFLVNWNKNSLVDEVWIKRIVDDVCTPWPIMDPTTLEDWIRQVDSCEDLNILIHFCRINGLSCHHFLFKDLPQWTDDMNEIVEIELMRRPPTVRVINPRQIQQRLRSLRGGPAKMGGKGLRIGPSTLECYLSWKEDIWVSTYVGIHRSWASPDSSASRVHRRLVIALRPCQEVPARSSAFPVAEEAFTGNSLHLQFSSVWHCACTPHPNPRSLVFCYHLTAHAPAN